MNKELEALETLKDIDIYTLNEEYSCHEFECCDAQGNLEDCYPQEVSIIEQALKEHEQHKVVEEELGLPLNVWVYLAKKELNKDIRKVYVENTIDDERQRQRFMLVNGRPQRHIIYIDFDKKLFQLQGTADEWCNKVPFSDYGKTIALTKEELE